MTRKLIDHLRGNIVGYVALFIALGGTGYAATALPRNSVGTPQLRNGAVSQSKLASGLGGQVWATTELSADGQVISSDPKDVKVTDWEYENPNFPGEQGLVNYPRRIPHGCVPLATASDDLGLTPSGNLPDVIATGGGLKDVQITTDGPTWITLAILCSR